VPKTDEHSNVENGNQCQRNDVGREEKGDLKEEIGLAWERFYDGEIRKFY
jgi:hypothetical protein